MLLTQLLLLSLTEPFIRMSVVGGEKNYPSSRQGLSNDVLNKDCDAASFGSIMGKKRKKPDPEIFFSYAH